MTTKKEVFGMNKSNLAYLLLLISGTAAILWCFLSDPILQDQNYHNFSDSTKYLSIPNFWNVISNLPFLGIGVYAIYDLKLLSWERIQYLIFFLGIVLASIGSAYYHWTPNDDTLVWDRLPMTLSFMSICSIIISEFLNDRIGRKLLFPFLIVGILSIFFWISFGDLRVYALVQFYPMIAIPLIVILFKSEYNWVKGYWFLLLSYLLAKFFEHFDSQVHEVLNVMSGHSLKHFAAAFGIIFLYYSYAKRVKQVELR